MNPIRLHPIKRWLFHQSRTRHHTHSLALTLVLSALIALLLAIWPEPPIILTTSPAASPTTPTQGRP